MIGKTISHYKILEKLGEGGMGVVYKARDLKLGRLVALKFLPPHLTSSEAEKKRFIQEAKAASYLDHNNICNIHEIDETDDGQLFICMAFYEGETLDKRIREKPLPVAVAINIATQIVQGLDKAHEKKITHRDIKPANIILTKEGVVKILDFGLAKMSSLTRLTQEGTTLGTIHYMSPEQVRGESVDHRSDIWSIGVIVYEMLTGRLAFKGDYDQAVIYGILNDQPGSITGLRTGVPLELERIVNRCISKDPQDRYQHADDLLSELNRLGKEPELEVSQLRQKGSEKKKRLNIVLLSFISIIVLSTAIYVVFKPVQDDKNEIPGFQWENSIAVLPFADLSAEKDQEYFCDGMTDKILTSLSKLSVLKVIARTSVMKYKNSDKTIPEIGEELGVENILEGSIFKTGDRIRVTAQLINTSSNAHLWADDYERKIGDVFDIQDDISEKIASNLVTQLSPQQKKAIRENRPKSTEAYEYFLKGRFYHFSKVHDEIKIRKMYLQKSEEMFLKAIELDPTYADAYACLADVINSRYNWFEITEEERQKSLSRQEEYLEKAFNLDSLSAETYLAKYSILYSKANKLLAEGEYEKYDRILYEQFNSLKKAISLNHNHSRAYYTLGHFYFQRGLNHLSMKYLSKAIELNPLDPGRHFWRGTQYLSLKEYSKAEKDYLNELELYPDGFITLKQLSHLYIALKKFTEAEKILNRIRRIYPDKKINLDYALFYAARGEKEKALKTFTGRNAFFFSLLQMKDEAINELSAWSQERLQQKASRYYFLKNQSFYDNLRSDPRFRELLAKHRDLYDENMRKYGDIDNL